MSEMTIDQEIEYYERKYHEAEAADWGSYNANESRRFWRGWQDAKKKKAEMEAANGRAD